MHGGKLGEYNEETATAADADEINISKALNTHKMQLELNISPLFKGEAYQIQI